MDELVEAAAWNAAEDALKSRGVGRGETSDGLALGLAFVYAIGWSVLLFAAWRIGIYIFTKTARVMWNQLICIVGTIFVTAATVFLLTFYGLRE